MPSWGEDDPPDVCLYDVRACAYVLHPCLTTLPDVPDLARSRYLMVVYGAAGVTIHLGRKNAARGHAKRSFFTGPDFSFIL